ncbi:MULTISPECIES: amino acid ABC transporter ATP-binding/permease protein [unclassified Oceanobacter]|uniref:amino acid ABC transporter ATP-binding/permease protein n=2 Tax=Gammaproteobacteria TaxID=1236 RepID=UPI002734B198|nr:MULTISPECIES: ATP-binding cassette domain-containing protein [unclassified Oceanobacter]MDP2505821.1 ATP-binding cassette domain-containing protein [Oceanobacter sp. 3_MG-2023]MDP2549341.1 ATP-binding cassette domain-containing protein [Oceanobacter sp. 4_MG-2023]MDP2609116.1 ATP-binding cassette domain-containing protein [Oceanobacter sp. 1_MG-2023]MDP2612438.1 ATP-binding cassette domain-containing protein [Oceanobacter sp. 2_MG-2023]
MKSLSQHYFRQLAAEQKLALLGIFLAVLTAFSGVALLAVSGWFISAAAMAGLNAVAAHQFNYFTPAAMVRGLSISRTLGRYGERLASHEATFRIISRLRGDLFRLIGRRQWQEIQLDRHESTSRLLQDVQHIESIYLSAVLPAVVNVATVLGYLLTLALVLPAVVPWAIPLLVLVVLVMPLLYSRAVLQAQDGSHQLRSEQWRRSSALLSNMRTLTLHGRLQAAGEQLVEQAGDADRQEVRAVSRQHTLLLLAEAGLVALVVVIFWQGFVAYQAGELAGANLFMLLLLTLGSGEVLLTAGPVVAAWQLGMKALQRLDQLAASDHVAVDGREFVGDREDLAVVLEQLHYRYPGQPAAVFDGFSHRFETQAGRTRWHWIYGPSGCGKSTLIALLAGQLQASAGAIRLSLDSPEGIGLMPQRIDILRASLRDNVCLNHPHSDDDILAALALVQLDEWAMQLPQGLDTWLGDGEWQASGGECKRLGLARLVLQQPRIILLDEPGAGMDVDLAQQVFANLADHWQHQLVIANSHDRDLILPGQQVLELG